MKTALCLMIACTIYVIVNTKIVQADEKFRVDTLAIFYPIDSTFSVLDTLAIHRDSALVVGYWIIDDAQKICTIDDTLIIHRYTPPPPQPTRTQKIDDWLLRNGYNWKKWSIKYPKAH